MTKKNIKKLRRDYLSSISLQNFRGYFKETNINFGKKITLFFGKGSVGKSTALEAINCLAESNKADSDLQGIKASVEQKKHEKEPKKHEKNKKDNVIDFLRYLKKKRDEEQFEEEIQDPF